MRRLLITLATGVFACANLHAATAPTSETVMADVPRLIERAKAGPYGRIWSHPDIAPLRALVETQLATVLKDRGPQIWEVLADVRSVIIRGAVQHDPASGLANSTIAVRLPARGEQAIALLKELLPPDAQTQPIQLLGEWLVIGKAPSDASTLMVAKSDDDQTSSTDIAEMLQQPEIPAELKTVVNALGLQQMSYRLRFDAQGTNESAELPGFQPPLLAIDPKALSALPDGALMVGALGIAGDRLDALLSKLSKDIPALAQNLGSFDRELQAKGMQPLTPTLQGWKGTMWFAVCAGAPFPTVTLGLPASKEVDALLALVASFSKVDLATADSEPLVLPLPPGVPLLIQVRRNAGQWVISSDQRVIDAFGSNTPGGFRMPKIEATSVGFFAQDTAGLLRAGMGYLPLLAPMIQQASAGAADGGASAKAAMAVTVKALNAALPHLPPSLITVQQNAQGVSVRGTNMSAAVMPMSVLAGMALPVIGEVRSLARRSQSGKNMSQIFGSMIAWQTTEEKWPPPSFEQLAKDMSIPKKLFQSPSNPAHPNPYLFITCIADPPSAQPVLIEDPACYKNQGTMVCFGDAHVKWIKGPDALRLWHEAKRLAALPKATMGGIELSDWSAVDDVLGIDP